jgi:hypothetical protein
VFDTDMPGNGVTVLFTGTEAGTYAYGGGGSGSFTQIESILGTLGDDTIDATAATGTVSIEGDIGQDTITGGSGNDSLYGGDDADTVAGGAGIDLIHGGQGSDSLTGGLGDDTVYGGAGDDSLSGGHGNDLLDGGDGDDDLRGDDGADNLNGGDGNDRLEGGAGNDFLDGRTGDDSLFGGGEDDTLSGGDGNDLLSGGTGDNTLTGGSGDDTFIIGDNAADVVTDFSLTDTDSDGRFDDQIDVSGLDDGAGGPVNIWNTQVVDDGAGNAKLIFPGGETLILQGVTPAQMQTPGAMHSAGIPCFTAGTLILTPRGEVPIESLRVGDLVCTRDNGSQPLLWMAMRRLDLADLRAAPNLRPVLIGAGALGNDRPVLVSPQHGVLARLPKGGGTEALVRAKHLARLSGGGVRVATACAACAMCIWPLHSIRW